MESLPAKDIADRDQLWAGLRVLRPQIEQLAGASEPLDSRDQQLAMLLARIVLAEVDHRARDGAEL